MFFDTQEQKILLGNSIPSPEMELDDAAVASDVGLPTEESALMQYYFDSISGSIGKSDFKQEYLAVKTQVVSNYDLKQQQMLADAIMNEISTQFDYEPTEILNVDSLEDLYEVYNLVEFLEYNNEDFISSTWQFLNPDVNKLDIELYCKNNSDKIIKEIEEQLQTKDFVWLISDFLRTNNKENLIGWFCERSKELVSLIKIRIMEGVSNV